LIKWKAWNSKHNSWVSKKNCLNSLKLINEYESRQQF
jgi:hypothetical protein